jgi:hypothetical protein
MKKGLRFILLGIEGIITVILTVALVHAINSSLQQGSWSMTRAYLLPSLVHLWVTMGVATLLCFFYRANIGAEAGVLPLLFLMVSLGNVKILPLYHSVTAIAVLSPYVVAIIYHFSLLYTSLLFLSSAIFQQAINPTKLGQYSFLGASIALFISLLAPVSINHPSFLWEVSVTNPLFSAVCILINLLAIFTFISTIIEEQFSRQGLLRPIAFILLIAGNAMVTMSQKAFFNVAGLLLYVAGATMLIMVTRTLHVWT